MRVLTGVTGGGVWGRVEVGGGEWFPEENKGKGEGGGEGGGWGRDRQVNAQALLKLPFSKLPFSFFLEGRSQRFRKDIRVPLLLRVA